MSKLFVAFLGFFAVLALGAPALEAQVKLSDGTVLADKPYFIVTYIEIAPGSIDAAAALLKAHSAASKKADGNLRFEALQGTGRKNHFALLETWADQAAREAHARSENTVKFRKALHALLYSPYDERPHAPLVAADSKSIPAGSASTVYVVTHVDIIPPEQFPPCKRQVSETGPCGNALVEKLAADSRKHAGNARFDVLTQANRPNHMTVVEMWTSQKAHDDHITHTDTRHFRDAMSGLKPGAGVAEDALFVINPLSGSLYDEQLYVLID